MQYYRINFRSICTFMYAHAQEMLIWGIRLETARLHHLYSSSHMVCYVWIIVLFIVVCKWYSTCSVVGGHWLCYGTRGVMPRGVAIKWHSSIVCIVAVHVHQILFLWADDLVANVSIHYDIMYLWCTLITGHELLIFISCKSPCT